MKKLFFFAVCFGMFTVANAQTDFAPEKGDFAVELGFTPFKAGGETFKLNEGMLKARYFISGKDAFRLKLGLGIDNTKSTYKDSYHPTETKWETIYDENSVTKDKNTNFSLMLGYERHFFTKGRFDVYAGLELGYLMEKYSGSETFERTEKTYNGNNDVTRTATILYNKDYKNRDTGGRSSMNAFNANIFAGVDFYVWKNLYLGAELGFNFKTGKSPNTYISGTENTTTVTYTKSGATTYSTTNITNKVLGETVDVTTTTTTSNVPGTTPGDPTVTQTSKGTNETKNTSFKLFVEPAIRIGWRF